MLSSISRPSPKGTPIAAAARLPRNVRNLIRTWAQMRKTVLVVEDDDDARYLYSTALAQRGYQVLNAANGAEGVHLARTHQPHLILLDIRMPLLDGWSALRYLRSYKETRFLPVFGISAYAPDDAARERAGSIDFDKFLLKPIEASAVVAAIERHIGPPDAEPPQAAMVQPS
jgi:CheY-like chemotaxis protein